MPRGIPNKAATAPPGAVDAAPVIPMGLPAPPPQEDPKPRICLHCAAWDQLTGKRGADGSFVSLDVDGLIGVCRRKSPVAAQAFNQIEKVGAITYSSAVWPKTFAGENCGEGMWD
jgi:hypothetical protein